MWTSYATRCVKFFQDKCECLKKMLNNSQHFLCSLLKSEPCPYRKFELVRKNGDPKRSLNRQRLDHTIKWCRETEKCYCHVAENGHFAKDINVVAMITTFSFFVLLVPVSITCFDGFLHILIQKIFEKKTWTIVFLTL